MDLEGPWGQSSGAVLHSSQFFMYVPAGTLVPAGLWRQFCSGASGENKREEVFPLRMNGFFTSSVHSQDRGIFFFTHLLQRLLCGF